MTHQDETWARPPDEEGFVERAGVRVHWERFGDGEQTVLFLPSWSIVPARVWKGQVHYFSRHFRVLVFDPRGNGKSGRPLETEAYGEAEIAADAVAVMDATGTERAALVGFSRGAQRALLVAAGHPERVTAIAFVASALPLAPPPTMTEPFDEPLDEYEGWGKYNEHYWRRDYSDFLDFFFAQVFTEPHSTKQMEDCVRWGHGIPVESLIATVHAKAIFDRETALELIGRVRCPVIVIHGDEDAVVPFERSVLLAEASGGPLVTFAGTGHSPPGREPVRFNLTVSEFLGGTRPHERRFERAAHRSHPRALYVSSPIGLGHAQRDLAIARELRARHPDLEIVWLAQDPVTRALEGAGETIHPASAQLAGEAARFEAAQGEHELHAFQAWRGLDEVLLANFMVFADVVRDEPFDLWIGDEAWELDYFLHENPELKTAPYAFLTDFVGWLPVTDEPREAFLTADYNAENIEQVERYPYVRDAALFVGEKEDVVPRDFGPGLPAIPDWVERHFDFTGYVLPFDPADYADTERLRSELGFDPERKLIVASVGGSAVGGHLLRRIAAGFRELRKDVPDAELLLVCGPRIDPATIEPVEGMRAVGYVHDLFRTFACCDLAVVQGGLTTTMELVATRRPFISVPLRHHFEQNHHVAHRLRRYGAPDPTPYDEATPLALAEQMRARLGAPVEYAPVAAGGAARAAALIAELLEERKRTRSSVRERVLSA